MQRHESTSSEGSGAITGWEQPHLREWMLSPNDLEKIVFSFKPLQELVDSTQSTVEFDSDESSVQVSIRNDDGMWLLYKLRNREKDGPGWQPTRLTQWEYNKPVDIFVLGRSVEESTYWLDPRYRLTDVYTTAESEFIRNPFAVLESEHAAQDLRKWFDLYTQVSSHREKIFPGFFARRKIPGLRHHILVKSEETLLRHGFSYLTAVPTWYHTAQLYTKLGFTYSFDEDKQRMDVLHAAVSQRKTKPEDQSWLVLLQFWIEKARIIDETLLGMVNPAEIIKGDKGEVVTYPLTPERNLWMYRKI